MTSSPSSSFPLPSDIIFEILTRTSLKTLDTCKAVNKEWHDLIFESSFMPRFCSRSQNISGYFVQTLSRTKHITEFVSIDGCSGNSSTTNKTPFHLPIDDSSSKVKPSNNSCNYYFDMKIEASSKQGILCCVKRSKNEYRYHVCKPSTKQWMKLPNPRTRYSTIKVALIVLRSNPLQFKIIRLSSPRTVYHHYRNQELEYYRSEIFESEIWEWRQGKDLLVPQGLYFDMFAPAVNANGLVYFKLIRDDNDDDQVMAINYNGEESFPRFSLPNYAFHHEYKDHLHNQLVEYIGKLGFTCLTPKGMELWVFENRRHVWELKKRMDTETVKGTLVGFYNADIALMKNYDEVVFYKLHDKSVNVVKLGKCPDVREIFPFRSDLEPIDLKE
ncbi:hypothetical protein HAX54_045190 [Datura stramonium]|uniref:F-box domain-containing protein n=1 Tax=Datura stramonium TaxID=4076 RepID=A0ABS8SQ30_DATST|nr:hypothetical protein [Datura stramonium]